jgi:putative transposase
MEVLHLRQNRPLRRKAVVTRGSSVAAPRKDERWSMRFCHDQLHDGRRIRVLTVVDQFTREALSTEARGPFSVHDVIDVLNRLSRSHRKPAVIQVDNGTEFASRALDAWTYREDVRFDFSRPGKPTDNAHIKSFNARLRAECLSAHVFESLEDAEETLTSWRSDYNAVRPLSALGMLTPREFAELGQRNAGR